MFRLDKERIESYSFLFFLIKKYKVMKVFVPFNTPSSKNSKISTTNKFTGKPMIIHSKTVSSYLKDLGIKDYSTRKKDVTEYVRKENLFRKAFADANWIKPKERIILGLHFARNTTHKFDFTNVAQIILDLMVAHDFIEDDNMDFILPIPMKDETNNWYTVNKLNPGVYIEVFKEMKVR